MFKGIKDPVMISLCTVNMSVTVLTPCNDVPAIKLYSSYLIIVTFQSLKYNHEKLININYFIPGNCFQM